ncbi:MAG: GAF domain-containing protein [Anaerolineales bacterium]|nr:GAF domain-containing protein [Anaerolineales bacterium]
MSTYQAGGGLMREQSTGLRARNSLLVRLTALTLLIALPILAVMAFFLIERARTQLEQDAATNLRALNNAVGSTISLWLDTHVSVLQTLAALPAIRSMDPEQQTPALKAMAAAYPQMYLVSTTDLQGMNIARNDDGKLTDYSDRLWYRNAASGDSPWSYQLLIGRTSGRPALVLSVPIRDDQGQVIGVAMFASELTAISQQVQTARAGQQGFAYIFDSEDRVVASPADVQNAPELAVDPNAPAAIQDFSTYNPVKALRSGIEGAYQFTDQSGLVWRAHLSRLSADWGVIVQQPENELLAPIRTYQQIAWTALGVSAVLLFILTYLSLRRSIQPIRSLTETAAAISAGDLSRAAPVQSQDEIGLLANTFNRMTAQLRQFITALEERVAERTSALERRLVQLQVTAEVAREAASFGTTSAISGQERSSGDRLMQDMVKLISERFGFYHAGIFLLDSGSGQSGSPGFAVLKAASSEGGQRMLARGHRLAVASPESMRLGGGTMRSSTDRQVRPIGIVGYVAGSGSPRIALDVGQDAVFFNNPDLPLTRSEMGLPLKVQEQVIGVLDVQSTEQSAFTQEDVEILQILADQIALAIQNSLLIDESRQTTQELQVLLSKQTAQRWQTRLLSAEGGGMAYSLHAGRVSPGGEHRAGQDERSGQHLPEATKKDRALSEEWPIMLRGEKLGAISLQRAAPWTPQERRLIEETLNQVALALDNARLLEEVQQRASQEEFINQVISRAQSSMNLETVMKNAVRDIGLAVSGARVRLTIAQSAPTEQETPPGDGDGQ